MYYAIMSNCETEESLKKAIYNFNRWVRNNKIPLSEAIIRHYTIHGKWSPSQRKKLGYLPYSAEELARLPSGVENYSMGAYNPCKHAEIRTGEKVLDIGCGAGVDVFLAASMVGESGMVIGIDVTFFLLQTAKRYADTKFRSCARFLQASGDALPIADHSIDVIISNGCLHLIPDKPQAFIECFRVLKEGGRAVLADMVAEDEKWEDFYENPLTYLYSGGGKQTVVQYETFAKAAGFSEFQFIQERLPWDFADEPMPGGYIIVNKKQRDGCGIGR